MSLTTDRVAALKLKALASDDKILWGVVANARPTRNKTRLQQVEKATGNGSTACALLCLRFGFDPYEVKK